jgi:phytoene dehydrogenase-like protein
MMTDRGQGNGYDAVVIGAGIGGLVTGAILARKEGWKVLVLEKEDVIGGKLYTFEHFEGDEKTFRQRLYRQSFGKVIRSAPPLSELIEKKVFSKYIFECGWHSIIAGDRGRLPFIASSLGAEGRLICPTRGFRLFGDGEWHGLRYMMRTWTEEDFREGKRVSRKMNLMSLEESDAYDHVDIRSYLKSQTRNEKVRVFHEWLALWEAGVNDPALVSAGEHIKVVSMVNCAGRDFEYGGGGHAAGGFNAVTRLFAGMIEERGGAVRTGIPVEQIVVEDYRTVGVRTAQGVIEAPRVICNVPMQRALPLLSDDLWPPEIKVQISRTQPLSGVLGWVNLKRALDPDFRGTYVVPILPGCRASDGFRGNVLFTYDDVATFDETRAPEGEGLLVVWTGLRPRDPDEIHNPVLIERVVNGMFSFFREQYPDFDQNVKWYFLTANEEMYSNSMTPGMVGNRRPPVKHPLVHDLYFTGDSVAQWSFGVSGAIGGAVNCASAATGKDYSTLLPFYMR